MHDLNGMKRVYYKVSEVPFNWKALRDNFNEFLSFADDTPSNYRLL